MRGRRHWSRHHVHIIIIILGLTPAALGCSGQTHSHQPSLNQSDTLFTVRFHQVSNRWPNVFLSFKIYKPWIWNKILIFWLLEIKLKFLKNSFIHDIARNLNLVFFQMLKSKVWKVCSKVVKVAFRIFILKKMLATLIFYCVLLSQTWFKSILQWIPA